MLLIDARSNPLAGTATRVGKNGYLSMPGADAPFSGMGCTSKEPRERWLPGATGQNDQQ